MINKRNTPIEVGDRVCIRTSGGTAAARKYAGKGGRVQAIEPGLDGIRLFYIRIEGNGLETAFEEQDLLNCIREG